MNVLGFIKVNLLICAVGVLNIGAATADQPPPVSGQLEFYVSPTGAGNGCTQAAPCSLSSAQLAVRAGLAQRPGSDFTVTLAGGVYSLENTWRFRPEDSGSAGHPVIWKAADGARPIISGGTRIQGWTLHDAGKGIWSAPVPANSASRQLYIDGKSVPIAQATPLELGFSGQWSGSATGYSLGSDGKAGTWFGALTPSQAKKVEFFYVGGNGAWTNSRCPVGSISSNSIVMAQPCWLNTTSRNQPPSNVRSGELPTMSVNQMPKRIENAYSLLSAGEWFLDSEANRLYYVPKSGQNMQQLDVRLPKLEALVVIAGTLASPIHDISFKGLQFSNATWNAPSLPSGFSEVQSNLHMVTQNQGLCEFYAARLGETPSSCPYGALNQPTGNVTVSAGKRISITDGRFENLGGVGLNVVYGSVDTEIRGNVFTDIAATAIILGCTYDPTPEQHGTLIKQKCTPNPDEVAGDVVGRNEILTGTKVDNNIIHDIGIDYWAATGITLLFSQNTKILNNHIYNTPYSGISAGVVQGHVNNANHPNNSKNINARNDISYNLIHDHMQKLHDGGAIYVEGHQAEYKYASTGEIDRLATIANGLLARGNVTHTAANNFAYYDDAGTEWINWDRNVSFNSLPNHENLIRGNGGCQVTGHFWVSGNYLAGQTRAYVCGVTAVDINFASDNKEIPNSAGISDIPQAMLTAAGLTESYRYLDLNEPTAVSYAAPVKAGSKILIAGAGFKPGTQVTFGGQNSAVQYLSPGFIVATAPASGSIRPLRVDGREVVPAPADKINHSLTATASATSVWSSAYGPDKAIDSNAASRWASVANTATLTQTFAGAVSINEIGLLEYYENGYRVGAYSIEARINGSWQQVASGTGIGNKNILLPTTVSATALRINVTSANGQPPSLYNFWALQSEKTNLSLTATASATSTWSRDAGYGPEKAIDSNATSRWASEANTVTLTQTFAGAGTISEIGLIEYYGSGGYRVGTYSIEALVNGSWQQIANGVEIGVKNIILPTTVVATAVRINLSSANGQPPSLHNFWALEYEGAN